MKILLVDDEPDIIELLRYNFSKEGFDIVSANNGVEAVKVAEKETPDIIIMDIMMPLMDGVEACRELRTIDTMKDKIIVLLTGRGESYSEIAGFESGADDYITKPVNIGVLKVRIQSLINRVHKEPEQKNIHLGDLIISFSERTIYKGKEAIFLPKKEFDLFALLSSKPDKLFTRDEIFNKIWGADRFTGKRTIDVHVRKLREKLGGDYIKTIRSVGYKIHSEINL